MSQGRVLVVPRWDDGGVEEIRARYRYRLRVNANQQRQLQDVFDSCRFVWNTALGRWSDLWRHEGLSYSTTDACRELTDWRSRFDWLAGQPVAPQQQTLRDLGRSISAFFDSANPVGRPRFKKRGRCASARWTVNGFSLVEDRLSVAVAGGRTALRVVWSRPLPSVPRSVTVYRDAAGRWWASFVVRVEAEQLPPSGRTTGLDLGLTTLATVEDSADDVANPRFAKADRLRQRRADRALARSKRNSGRRAKAKRRRAKVHAGAAARRQDYFHKEARRLARTYDRIGVEDLRIKNMLANRHLSRAISDAGWGEFLAILEWQARKTGREVVHLDPRNTTQSCSECGTKAKSRLGLADRFFACNECGLVLCRDRNAARNLNPGWAVSGVGDDARSPWPLWGPRQPEPRNPCPSGR